MKLVVLYTSGDDCTYSCDNVIPVEYESPEKFIVDFQEALEKVDVTYELGVYKDGIFKVAGQEFDQTHFYYYTSEPHPTRKGKQKHTKHTYLPDVLTVDEWFAQHYKE